MEKRIVQRGSVQQMGMGVLEWPRGCIPISREQKPQVWAGEAKHRAPSKVLLCERGAQLSTKDIDTVLSIRCRYQ